MYIARQPILDREQRIAGYELLFRTGGGPIEDGVRASATVAVKAFADAGFGDVLGPHRGFINVDAPFLMSDMVELLPPQRTVLELLETMAFTAPVVERCRELKARGYVFAADDYCGDFGALAPALEYVSIVKVDLPQVRPEDHGGLALALAGKTLLAEKVETEVELRLCRNAGYALFQGYYFARPERVGGTGRDPERVVALGLLAAVLRDADDAELEGGVKRHPGLAMGLLRLVNSAAAGLAQPIVSMRQALFHVGRAQMTRWLQILVYLGASGGNPGDQPLLQLAAVRGKLMERLAQALGRTGQRAFLVGMVSLFDVATGLTHATIARRLVLDEEIVAALTGYGGELGQLLALAEAMERGDDAAVVTACAALPGLPVACLAEASRSALQWAGTLCGARECA